MAKRKRSKVGHIGEATSHTSGASWLRRTWSNPAYRFVALFLLNLGIVAAAYILLTTNFFSIVESMMTGTAEIVGFLIGVFSSDVTVGGKYISFGSFPVKIIEECTGIYEVLIFMAAVIAFPTSIRKKLIGLSFGIPVMYLFNVMRIIALIVVGRYWYSTFEFMHLYFWQVTLILMITSVWAFWIIKVVKSEEAVPASDI
jgi:archaeosortase B (VPXXXP-CTERM-specific)